MKKFVFRFRKMNQDQGIGNLTHAGVLKEAADEIRRGTR